MTLVGFLRDDRFNVYAHPERVLVGAPRVTAQDHPAPAEALDAWLAALAAAGWTAPLSRRRWRSTTRSAACWWRPARAPRRAEHALRRHGRVRGASRRDGRRTAPGRCVRPDRHRRAGARRLRRRRPGRGRGEPSATRSRSPAASAPATTSAPPPRTSRAGRWCCGPAPPSTVRHRRRRRRRPCGAGRAPPPARRGAGHGRRDPPAGEPLTPGETADANGPMLAALAPVAGAAVERHPPCVDDPEQLSERCGAASPTPTSCS